MFLAGQIDANQGRVTFAIAVPDFDYVLAKSGHPNDNQDIELFLSRCRI